MELRLRFDSVVQSFQIGFLVGLATGPTLLRRELFFGFIPGDHELLGELLFVDWLSIRGLACFFVTPASGIVPVKESRPNRVDRPVLEKVWGLALLIGVEVFRSVSGIELRLVAHLAIPI